MNQLKMMLGSALIMETVALIFASWSAYVDDSEGFYLSSIIAITFAFIIGWVWSKMDEGKVFI